MRTVSLGTLVTRCRQRADLENDSHIGSTEAKTLISEMVGELHELADEVGMRYFETTATITATGASSYTLPTDHLSTIRIAKVDSSGRRCLPLREVQVHDNDGSLRGQTGDARFFAIIGQTIEFYPNPSSGTYAHVYVPQPVDLGLSEDATSIDLICPAGEAFVVWGTAVKLLAKSESDVQVAMAEREAARERVRTWLMSRMLTTPRRQTTDDDILDEDRGVRPPWWTQL